MNDKMTDAELPKILGRYQAAESIGIFLGALCVIAGCVLAFVLHELIVVLILGFSGVVLLLLIALPAQKKKNALICVLLALVCAAYIGLTLLFVDAVSNQPPTV